MKLSLFLHIWLLLVKFAVCRNTLETFAQPPQKSSLETALETFISKFSQNQQYYPQFEEIQVSPCQAQPPEINYPQPPQNSNLEILLQEFISAQEKKK